MHMIKKGQMILADGKALSAADQFYSPAASLRLLEAGCADQVPDADSTWVACRDQSRKKSTKRRSRVLMC